MLLQAIGRLKRAVGMGNRTNNEIGDRRNTTPPMIGAAVERGSACPAPDSVPMIAAAIAVAGGLPIIVTSEVAQNSPTIARKRGLPYAKHFAEQFVAWVRITEQPVTLEVEAVLALASQGFAPANGLVMPVERNFLGALKRLPGIDVKPDRHKRDSAGRPDGKTTLYVIKPFFSFRAEDTPPADRTDDRLAA